MNAIPLRRKLILFNFLIGLAPLGHAADSPQIHEQKERATTALEQALKTDPNNAELWSHLGFAYRKLGQMEQAQSAFEKASTLNPRSAEALYMLGLIYESKHQRQEALRTWNDYLSVETDAAKRTIAENHVHALSQ